MGRGDGKERYLLNESSGEGSFFCMLINLMVGINGCWLGWFQPGTSNEQQATCIRERALFCLIIQLIRQKKSLNGNLLHKIFVI